jgi:hypothetical protein
MTAGRQRREFQYTSISMMFVRYFFFGSVFAGEAFGFGVPC